jgi:hypothetical protein
MRTKKQKKQEKCKDLKLPPAERVEYDDHPNVWVEVYKKEHPGTFQPSLQQSIRKWMSDFSNQFKLQSQSELDKKEWNKVLNHAAIAVSECLK